MALPKKAAKLVAKANQLADKIRELDRHEQWRYDEDLDEDVKVFEASTDVEILWANVGLYAAYCRDAFNSRQPKWLTADDIRRERHCTLRRVQWLVVVLQRAVNELENNAGPRMPLMTACGVVEDGYRKWYKYHW